jgi:hypothetical protein
MVASKSVVDDQTDETHVHKATKAQRETLHVFREKETKQEACQKMQEAPSDPAPSRPHAEPTPQALLLVTVSSAYCAQRTH